MELIKIPMPSWDGAPFTCSLEVPAPKPVWWAPCEKRGVQAFRPSGGGMNEYRCAEHIAIHSRFSDGTD